jgi:flagellar motor switch protein FliN/FliY
MFEDKDLIDKNNADLSTEEFIEEAAEGLPLGEDFGALPDAINHIESASAENINSKDLKAVFDVPVQISAVLGRAIMPVNQLLKLGRGAIIELDKKVGESVEIFVNNKLVARGEVVVIDERLGITMTEIIKSI